MIVPGPSGVSGQIVVSHVEMAQNLPKEVLLERKCLEENAKELLQNLDSALMVHAQVKLPPEKDLASLTIIGIKI